MALPSRSISSTRYFRRLLRSSRPLAIMARSSSTLASSGKSKVLPFSEIPGPKGTIRNCLDYALSTGLHLEVITKRFERLGPIYSEQILDMRIVNLSDVDAIMKVLRSEKAFQMRPGFEALAEILAHQNISGLTSNDYHIWYPDRLLLSPKMLRPKDISATLPIVNSVANDFMDRLYLLTQSDGKVNNIEKELHFWTVESFASMLFNQRLGFYNNPPDPTAVAFVDASVSMVHNIGKLFKYAPLHRYIKIPAYYRLKKNMATIHAIGADIVDKVLATKREQDSSNKQSLFEYLVANGWDTPKSMAMVTGLMAAGTDTTSTTCIWLLYLLSRHPDTQEKLHQELVSTIGPDGEVLASNIPPFLKAALKESERMYPVGAYVIARVFDKDLDVLGYHIPSGVTILMHEHLVSLDERYYGTDAKKFVPERWLRDETGRIKKEVNPFTFLPFGYGVRMCIGRRMAESVIYTLVSKILLSYRLEYADEFENGVNRSIDEGIVKPDRPVLLKFIPRE